MGVTPIKIKLIKEQWFKNYNKLLSIFVPTLFEICDSRQTEQI